MHARSFRAAEPPAQLDVPAADVLLAVSFGCARQHCIASRGLHAPPFHHPPLPAFGSCSLPPPEVLRPLTNLESLVLFASQADIDLSRSETDAALRALPHLTSMYLQLPPPLPQAVTGLVQLQHLETNCCGTAPPDVLPSGPWLASLRELTLRGSVAVSTIQVLQAATRLESL